MEVRENKGSTSIRQWEIHHDTQAPGSQNGQQDMTESEEERPLVIDLEDEESDLFTEDSEVTRMRKKVITDLTIEGWNSYKCKVCSFTTPLHVRLRNHISNRHFNGPICICKICGLK